MSDDPRDTLRRLEARLSQASEAAERLFDEASRSARGGRPPPAGWQMPNGHDESQSRGPWAEFETLLAALGLVRELIPPEVLERLATAVRELLLALRALIDVYLERLERPRPAREQVRDIPIE
ncbi:MAG: hypothetical protein JO244_00285 [Solirubrobacterales bacterium]|nr:hypothetical protein [Solirubrobacterales bacterium]